MVDQNFKVGDRVKINPAYAECYTRTWRRLIETGREATVATVFGEDARLFAGDVTIEFDGKFKYPEKGRVSASRLILVEPKKEANH